MIDLYKHLTIYFTGVVASYNPDLDCRQQQTYAKECVCLLIRYYREGSKVLDGRCSDLQCVAIPEAADLFRPHSHLLKG